MVSYSCPVRSRRADSQAANISIQPSAMRDVTKMERIGKLSFVQLNPTQS
jgi:hypothetical protein